MDKECAGNASRHWKAIVASGFVLIGASTPFFILSLHSNTRIELMLALSFLWMGGAQFLSGIYFKRKYSST